MSDNNAEWKIETSDDGATETRIRLVSPSGHVFKAVFPVIWDYDSFYYPTNHKEALAELEQLVRGNS